MILFKEFSVPRTSRWSLMRRCVCVALSSVYNAKLFILYCQGNGTTNGNSGNAQSVETEPLFIESLAPHLGLKSVSELNWEGLVAENEEMLERQSCAKRRSMK